MGPSGSKKRKVSSESEDESSSDDDGRKQPAEKRAKKQPEKSLKLEPPTFSLDDLDPKRFELWTIRLPAAFPVEALDGRQLAIPSSAAATIAGGAVLAPPGSDNEDNGNTSDNKPIKFSIKENNFTLRWGNQVENDSFRVLVPNPNNNNANDDEALSDDENEDEKKTLVPANAPFHRHVNLVSLKPVVPATELAPGADRAPSPDVTANNANKGGPAVKLRKAYEYVPQKTGLKRRWMPLGAAGGAQTIQSLEKEAARERSLSSSSFLSAASFQQRKRPPPTNVSKPAPAAAKRPRKNSDSSASSNGQQKATLKRPPPSSNTGTSEQKSESKAERKARKAERKAKKEAKKKKTDMTEDEKAARKAAKKAAKLKEKKIKEED